MTGQNGLVVFCWGRALCRVARVSLAYCCSLDAMDADSAADGGKVKIRLGADDDPDSDDECSTPEQLAVKGKLDVHPIKRLSTLLKAASLASVDGMLKRHLKAQAFARGDGTYAVPVAPLVLHGGMRAPLFFLAPPAAPHLQGRHLAVDAGLCAQASACRDGPPSFGYASRPLHC